MTDKKKAASKSSPKSSRLNNTSTRAQRERLLAALIQLGSVNTLFCRDRLNQRSRRAGLQPARTPGASANGRYTDPCCRSRCSGSARDLGGRSGWSRRRRCWR